MIASRRTIVASLFAVPLAAMPALAKPAPVRVTVYKDPNCGCCTAWADRMRATGRLAPVLVDDPAMMDRKIQLRVPPELASCHTSVVGGYVIEGHVPAADILTLLATRPKGVIGLAVPGMPAGSPGMEVPNGRRAPYDVIAFTATGAMRLFSRQA